MGRSLCQGEPSSVGFAFLLRQQHTLSPRHHGSSRAQPGGPQKPRTSVAHVPSAYRGDSIMKLTVWSFATSPGSSRATLPGDTLQSLGPPPWPAFPPILLWLLWGPASHPLRPPERSWEGRLLPTFPATGPPGREQGQQGLCQTSKTFLGPRQNSAVNWPPVEGRLGLGWEEGAFRARGGNGGGRRLCCQVPEPSPAAQPAAPRLHSRAWNPASQWDTLHPGPHACPPVSSHPVLHGALQRNGAPVHSLIILLPSS